MKWLEHFLKLRSVKRVPILDGKFPHCSALCLNLRRKTNIAMLCLPPHSTHFIKPMDRTLFKPLETLCRQDALAFAHNHTNTSITKSYYRKLFTAVWNRRWRLKTERENSPVEVSKETRWRGAGLFKWTFSRVGEKEEGGVERKMFVVGFVWWSGVNLPAGEIGLSARCVGSGTTNCVSEHKQFICGRCLLSELPHLI